MCGINGIICSSNDFNLSDKINLMNDLIKHRGPDDDGVFIENNNLYNICFGMRRLSIIDISKGAQPIFTEDNRFGIVFNGEIYNYKEIRTFLEANGFNFFTESDTEVILKLFQFEGPISFSRLDGMFAICIYDRLNNKVFLARDYFGEKPLYYHNSNKNGFIFSSELKSIINVLETKFKISKKGLSLFFQLSYIPAPFTIYDQIFKLEANKYIELNCNTLEHKIFTIEKNVQSFDIKSKKQAIETTKNLIFKSVKSRSIADVPIGSFLSGGVDSSIVSMCMSQLNNKPIETYSIGFENKKFDESKKAKIVSNIIGSKHNEFIISDNNVLNSIDLILKNFDEPFADSSAIPSYLVSLNASKNIKVAMTGDGGDEVFAGYNKYYIGIINKLYTKLISQQNHKSIKRIINYLFTDKYDVRGLNFKIKKAINSIDYDDEFYFNIISLSFKKDSLKDILKQEFIEEDSLMYFKQNDSKIDSLLDFRNIDKSISLDGDLLTKVDRVSMLSSIECRSPFLNKEIWDFTSQIPENFLISKTFQKKYLLKEAFKEYFPNNFLNSKKQGFGIPVGDWLRKELKNDLLNLSNDILLKSQGIFVIENVKSLINDHLNNSVDNTFKIWTFYCFQKWYFIIYEK
jgi:asparagine synthase (glutamine-hydrolysing)